MRWLDEAATRRSRPLRRHEYHFALFGEGPFLDQT